MTDKYVVEKNIDDINGYIYVYWNTMFQYYGECYKIGSTKDIHHRLNGYTTNFPEK